MSSYIERANMVEAGLASKYYLMLVEYDVNNILSEEQLAIMALILDKAQDRYKLESYKVQDYIKKVVLAQSLMPNNGGIVSRQVLVQLWLQSRLEYYIKLKLDVEYYEDI